LGGYIGSKINDQATGPVDLKKSSHREEKESEGTRNAGQRSQPKEEIYRKEG